MRMPYSNHCLSVCKFLWMQLRPENWSYLTRIGCVDYPWGVDVHGLGILVLWPLTLVRWPWPLDPCGCCVQGINANVAILSLCTTHEGLMHMDVTFCSDDLGDMTLCFWWRWIHHLRGPRWLGQFSSNAGGRSLGLCWPFVENTCTTRTHDYVVICMTPHKTRTAVGFHEANGQVKSQ